MPGKSDQIFKNSDSELLNCVAIAHVVSTRSRNNGKRHPTPLPSLVTQIDGIYALRDGNHVVLRCVEGASGCPQRHNSCGKMIQSSRKTIQNFKKRFKVRKLRCSGERREQRAGDDEKRR